MPVALSAYPVNKALRLKLGWIISYSLDASEDIGRNGILSLLLPSIPIDFTNSLRVFPILLIGHSSRNFGRGIKYSIFPRIISMVPSASR